MFSALVQLIVLNSEAILYVVGCSTAAHGLCLLHARKIPVPRCDSQKCLRTVTEVCWAANLDLAQVLLWLGKKYQKINTARLFFSLLHVHCWNSWLIVSGISAAAKCFHKTEARKLENYLLALTYKSAKSWLSAHISLIQTNCLDMPNVKEAGRVNPPMNQERVKWDICQ